MQQPEKHIDEKTDPCKIRRMAANWSPGRPKASPKSPSPPKINLKGLLQALQNQRDFEFCEDRET